MQANDRGDELVRNLYGLIQAVRRTKHDDPVDRPAIIILARLREQGPMRLSDLAAVLCLDVSTMSRQVRTLEERGYVERTEDPADRRAVHLTLTAAGRTVLATAFANRRAWLDRSLADWPPEEREALTELLGRLTAALTPETPTRTDTQEESA